VFLQLSGTPFKIFLSIPPTLITTRRMTKEIFVKIFMNFGVFHQTTLSHFTVDKIGQLVGFIP